MGIDSQILKHREWLGLLQPVGLVVSPLALTRAQAIVDISRPIELQARLQELDSLDFPTFTQQILDWEVADLVPQSDLPDSMTLALPEYGELLQPTYGVKDPDRQEWIVLVQVVADGQDLDKCPANSSWNATVQERFERLLRSSQIPTGILWNGEALRLVYAPRGESSGHLTFPLAAMGEVAGRLILGALDTLLNAQRMFNGSSDRRLPQILASSRDYQSAVSEQLAEQVVDALWELLRGFQIADGAANGRLLGNVSEDWNQHLYGGLITTLMRLVFMLYAEDEGIMPNDPVYQQYYSVSGLYEQLRSDNSSYPDTMDDRYGAWVGLLSLFRLIYEGGGATPDYLPARYGQLFDPQEFPFLEGNSPLNPASPNLGVGGQICSTLPQIPDGVIYRVLDKLLMLDGERLSYRSLDVEQIGSVYEGIMGYTVNRATRISIGVNSKPKGSKHSTTVVVDVEGLLAAKSGDRAKLLKEWANCELAANAAKGVKEAQTIDALIAAIGQRVSGRTKQLLPVGSLYLQPTEERRRSGSHYTPRKLTQPIVENTLRPILAGLGDTPTAAQILELKVCDLAMGSGAFLVEACRQLAEQVVAAWNRGESVVLSGEKGEDEPLLMARRLVAQQCLYGVDKNPFAVNLAKLSLWLVTLSRDLPFTFLDHALKCGDSLVGRTRREINAFGQIESPLKGSPIGEELNKKLLEVKLFRSEIQVQDTRSDAQALAKAQMWQSAELALAGVRLRGDVSIAAFFDGVGKNKQDREDLRRDYAGMVQLQPERMMAVSARLRERVMPFNWEIEFPEVFDRENGGFDAIVGNPPFLGGRNITTHFGDTYSAWLLDNTAESSGESDLVGHFFRRAFDLLRQKGTFGLIATNTIFQGATRNTGLKFICNNNGTIYRADKRLKWPGLAAVVVSVVFTIKGKFDGITLLDGRKSDKITAFLFHAGGNDDPQKLLANQEKSFQGSITLGMGFTFDDGKENITTLSEMKRLIEKDPRNQERIFPYIGGDEVNSSPNHAHHRYVINFGEVSEEEAWKYPDLMQILEAKVKSERLKKSKEVAAYPWWQFWRTRKDLHIAIESLDRVLVTSLHSPYLMFTFLPAGSVFSHALAVFAFDNYSAVCVLQSSIHEIWVRFFGSSIKDDLRYTPSDCFETFPFPANWETNRELESIGQEYYEFRASLMIRNNQGLTATYNRFHDREEDDAEILKLRQLHTQMDTAVLAAYGWTDISTTCEFRLDYEDEEPSDTQPTEGKRQRKKPWRYRWPEATHDEVLARLLELNQHRHEAEILGGKHAQKKANKSKAKGTKAKKLKGVTVEKQLNLIPPDVEQLDMF
jgi:N-6 DNA Methylase